MTLCQQHPYRADDHQRQCCGKKGVLIPHRGVHDHGDDRRGKQGHTPVLTPENDQHRHESCGDDRPDRLDEQSVIAGKKADYQEDGCGGPRRGSSYLYHATMNATHVGVGCQKSLGQSYRHALLIGLNRASPYRSIDPYANRGLPDLCGELSRHFHRDEHVSSQCLQSGTQEDQRWP